MLNKYVSSLDLKVAYCLVKLQLSKLQNHVKLNFRCHSFCIYGLIR